jgi:hypothetical protein
MTDTTPAEVFATWLATQLGDATSTQDTDDEATPDAPSTADEEFAGFLAAQLQRAPLALPSELNL